MAYRCIHRFADISPTKVRPLAKIVSGQNVSTALDRLKFMPQRGARYLEKVILSAIRNAENAGVRNTETMAIVEARVDEAPRLKRIQPRSRGMAFAILKRLCHIHVSVGE